MFDAFKITQKISHKKKTDVVQEVPALSPPERKGLFSHQTSRESLGRNGPRVRPFRLQRGGICELQKLQCVIEKDDPVLGRSPSVLAVST